VTNDAIIRTVALVAAAALLAAPYRQHVMGWLAKAAEAAKAHRALAGRIAAAALLIAAAWGKIPMPSIPATPGSVVFPLVATPSDEMKASVSGVVDAIRSAPIGDRLLWSQLWSKAAVVVDGDAVLTETVFTDSRSLRGFVVLSLDIGWRRLGGNQPGKYAGLRDAVESAFSAVIGKEDLPVTPDLRKRFADLCRALAWAALPPQG
jgi:hypothetical protein